MEGAAVAALNVSLQNILLECRVMKIRHLALLSILTFQLGATSVLAAVEPGPCADKRQQLQTYLEKAKATGFGTAPYEAALVKIEENVKAGQPEAEILKQVNSLTAAISAQVKSGKAIRASGMSMGGADITQIKKLKKLKTQIPVSQLESYMLTLVNKHRKENNIPSVGTDSILSRCAREHADDMVKRDYMNHTNPEGLDGLKRAMKAGYKKGVRENLARTKSGGNGIMQVEEADVGLMNSPGHRANILDPDLKYVGIGISYEPVTWQIRVCQMYGK